jgi:tRNA A-37 threonylcarbamoyl transferase component Bud32
MTDDIYLTRKRSDTEWTVTSREGLIIKRYKILTLRGFIKGRWRREHAALLRLEAKNVPAPKTHSVTCEAKNIYTHQREKLSGTPLLAWDNDKATELGRYIAQVHQAGVTLGDMATDNFLMTDAGNLVFIDYGRARVFLWRGLAFYWHASKDLARTKQNLLAKDADLIRAFYSGYRASAGVSGTSLLHFFERFW